MKNKNNSGRTSNAWQSLEKFTHARIGLGRVGVSQTTQHHLAFQLAHACARDAVNRPMQWDKLKSKVDTLALPCLHLSSQANSRAIYLQRPDLGRTLSRDSSSLLNTWKKDNNTVCDCVIVIADGLSSIGIEQHSFALLEEITHQSPKQENSPKLVCLVEQGRVAIGDQIAQALNAKFAIVIIGERPGLSSPDSLGIYFTLNAHSVSSDADRNCISNIRPGGLNFSDAASRLHWLLAEASRRNVSGVQLKDESRNEAISKDAGDDKSQRNFLLP